MPRWLPNAISMSRIALAPLWLMLAFAERERALGGPSNPFMLLVVLAFLGASDVLDGWLARRYGLTSNLGATLDAVADKLAQISTVTFLAWFAWPAFTALPRWLWAALIARDAMLGVGWLTVWARHREVRVEHRWFGKLSSWLLFALTFAATAGAPPLLVAFGSVAALVLIVPGTAAYMAEGWRQLVAGSVTHR